MTSAAALPDCEDHEERLDKLERRFHEFDGVVKALRIAGLLLGIIVSLFALLQVTGLTVAAT